MQSKKLQQIQKDLEEQKIDGWLLFDYRHSNELACKVLEIPSDKMLTRRLFYWIPQKGEPVKIVHRIESGVLDHLAGSKKEFHAWEELEKVLKETLSGAKTVAMEYSPRNAIPDISKVDAGTVERIQSLGIKVVSSGDLLQKLTSVWDEKKLKSHLEAADVLDKIISLTWKEIKQKLEKKEILTEYDVHLFMRGLLEQFDCKAEEGPICAVNGHSADPHYMPEKKGSSSIKMGDFILLDLWGKKKERGSVYADITRVGVADKKPTAKQEKIFSFVKAARDAATEFVKKSFASGKVIRGFEVDRVCRKVIADAGYGEYFVHRTGHNIDERDHGPGAHIDSLETLDERKILPGTCFSIEPGIYLPGEFGVRMEYDVYVHHDGAVQVTGGIQTELMTF